MDNLSITFIILGVLGLFFLFLISKDKNLEKPNSKK